MTRRRGFTLVEMLVVVAVLAALAGVSWPAIARTLGKNELRAAAKQVRAAILKTRLRAVETGAPWQFGYWLGSGRCESRPLDSDDEPPARSPAAPSRGAESIAATLPDSVAFVDPADDGAPAVAASAPDREFVVAAWFFPNGRGTDARLRLAGQDRAAVALTVHGLTGTVSVGPIAKEEAPP